MKIEFKKNDQEIIEVQVNGAMVGTIGDLGAAWAVSLKNYDALIIKFLKSEHAAKDYVISSLNEMYKQN